MSLANRLEKKNIDFTSVLFDAHTTLSDRSPARRRSPKADSAQPFVIKADQRYYLCVIPEDASIELQWFKRMLKAEQISLASLDELDSLLADSGEGLAGSGSDLTAGSVWDESSACRGEYVIIPIGKPNCSASSKTSDFEPAASGD